MTRIAVVAHYKPEPAEGMEVISKMLVDRTRLSGHLVEVIEPARLSLGLLRLVTRPFDAVVFTHGPGTGVVLLSALLRWVTRSRIIWVATRPDLGDPMPGWLTRRGTAHVVIGNRMRADVQNAAHDADFVQQFIGIEPTRMGGSGQDPWPELTATGRPIILHVGHLRPNRGLDLLARAKRVLGDEAEVVVQGSPTFQADPQVVVDLEDAGVHVRRDYVEAMGDLYRAADLYVFPVRPSAGGAIDLPLGALEALACRCPVLVTQFGALRQALEGTPGVTFTSPDRLVDDLVELVRIGRQHMHRPDGLPPHLHADRLEERFLQIVGTH